MDRIKKIRAVLKIRPARKITIVSVILTIIIAIILFLGSFVIVAMNEVNLLESSVSALPELMQERVDKLKREYDVYKNDYTALGELATLLYNEYEGLETSERLEFIRNKVEALDVTVLDSNGKLVASTSKDAPSIGVTHAFAAINETPEPLYDPNLDADNIKKEMNDEDGYIPETDSMPMVYDGRTNDGNIIMVEFDYASFGKLLAEQTSYEGICQRVLAGMEGYAFMRDEDGSLSGYPPDELDESVQERFIPEIMAAFDKSGITVDMNDRGFYTKYALSSLMDKLHLLVQIPASVVGVEFMLAIPVSSFIWSMVMCDLAILALVVVGYVLFCRYATRSFRKLPVKEEDKRLHARKARRQTRPGALVMVIATCVLASMLLMLEGMSNTAEITMGQQKTISYETDYRTQRKSDINKEYSKRYTTRAAALGQLLSDHPELRTREALQRFSTAIQAEYLMLIDKNGNEILSSNNYTGFSLNDERSGALEEWRPVLQGYDQVETPTKKNEVTGKYERTVATLLTDEDGLPDGMVVMAVDDDGYMSEIGDASLEGVVKSFTPRKGQVVGVVDNETGQFVAHTNAEMVGEMAENYLDKSILARDYEGYTVYDGDDVYVSGVSSEGKTTLVITNNSGSDDDTRTINWDMVLATIGLMLLVFYPAAASLCSKYARIRTDEKKSQVKGHPLKLFYHGYVAYIAVLALVSYLGYIAGFWKAFGFVYSGKWTHGLHLFSIWSALFLFAIASYITTGLHRAIGSIDEKANAQTRTFARLVDSLVTYAIFIIVTVRILTVLGVDTATIIGSVSIVSIAIGMGTQDLVKDVVAGLFLAFEGTIHVGDIVEIGSWRGRVTDMGVRTTEITNEHNDVKILTNSKIGDVVNRSKVKTLCTEEFELSRTVEVAELPNLVDTYIDAVVEGIPEIKDSLELGGITSITEDSYTVRLTYMVNEADRESVTIRLRNAMQLLLEAQEEESEDEE